MTKDPRRTASCAARRDWHKVAPRCLVIISIILFLTGSALAQPASGPTTEDNGGSQLSLEYLGSFGGKVGHKVRHGKIGVASMGTCIEIVDCADVAHPKLLARRWVGDEVFDLDFTEKALYVAVRREGIRVLDISDPAKPLDRGRFEPYEVDTRVEDYQLEIRNQILLINGEYVKGYTSLEAVDIHDPWHPKSVATKYSGGDSDEAQQAEEKIQQLAGKKQPHAEETFEYESPFKDAKALTPVEGNTCCLIVDGQLCTVDIAAPGYPKIVGRLALPGGGHGRSVSQATGKVYCFFTEDSLYTVSLANPASPKILGRLPFKDGQGYVRDKTLIASNAEGIHFISLKDPGNPVLISTIKVKGVTRLDWPRTLVVSADEDKELVLYDLSDLKHPRQSGQITLPRPWKDIQIANHRAYVACLDLQIINLEDPAHPRLEGIVRCEDPEEAEHAKEGGYDGFRARYIALNGHYVYCEPFCIDASNPKIPRIVNQEMLGDLYHTSPIDVFGKWGIKIEMIWNRNWGSFGSIMKIYDLADPLQPREVHSLGCLDEETGSIIDDRLYLTGEKSGTIVLKLTSQAEPQKAPGVKRDEQAPAFRRVPMTAQNVKDFAGLKQIKIAGELACSRQGDRTLLTIDLAKPTQPHLLGRCELPGPFGSMAIDGKYCFAGGTDGTIYTVDLSKPSSPQLHGTFKPDDASLALAASGGRLYAATKAGLSIMDTAAPDQLKELGRFKTAFPCSDLATSGTMVYLAAQGMEIVDTANAANPVLRFRFPSAQAFPDRIFPYSYGPEGSATQEIKRLGNIVYLITVSRADITNCQIIMLDVSNPDKPRGAAKVFNGHGPEFEVRGVDLDAKAESEEVRALAQPKSSGWLLGLPVKTPLAAGYRAALMFFDLTNPDSPVFIGSYEGLTDPRKPVLYKNLVYVADEKLGLVILRLAPPGGKGK